MDTKNNAVKAPKKEKKAHFAVPSKKTMNFVHHQSSFNPKKMIPLIIILVIASGIFVKFGIMDLLELKNAKYAVVAARQEELSGLKRNIADYDKVAEEFGRYSYGWMTEEEGSLVERMDVFKLVEAKIAPNAVIEDYALTDNILAMSIHGLTLEHASAMVKDLETSDLVQSATLHDAVAENAENASITLTLILTKEAK